MTVSIQWTNDNKQIVLDLRSQGKSYSEIAKYIGVPLSTIKGIMQRMTQSGEYTKTSSTWTEAEVEKLLELRKKGKKLPEIANVLGKSHSSVKTKASMLIRAGLCPRDKDIPRAIPILPLKIAEEVPTMEYIIEQVKIYVSSMSAPLFIRRWAIKYFGSWTNALYIAGISGNIGGVFNKDKLAILYYLDFGEVKKIGITQQGIKNRFAGSPPYQILDSIETDLDNAIYLEKELKKIIVKKLPSHPWFERNGKTECFESDCLTIEDLFSKPASN